MKIGLKLWSTNANYISSAESLYAKGMYDLIELYVVPGTFKQYKDIWKSLSVPFTLHVPHTIHGFNLAHKVKLTSNMQIFSEVESFSKYLGASSIIIHPGITGELATSLTQFTNIKEQFNLETYNILHIENKPYMSLHNEECRGSTFEEMQVLLSATGLHFCLDIGHAIKTAIYLKQDIMAFVEKLIAFNPNVVHISDGVLDNYYDEHLHLGHGNFPLAKILTMLNKKVSNKIVIESNKNSQDNLEDFEADVYYLREKLLK